VVPHVGPVPSPLLDRRFTKIGHRAYIVMPQPQIHRPCFKGASFKGASLFAESFCRLEVKTMARSSS